MEALFQTKIHGNIIYVVKLTISDEKITSNQPGMLDFDPNFFKAHQATLAFIPKMQVRAFQAFPKCQTFYVAQNRMITDHFGKSVKRNTAIQVMYMVNADIA